MARDDRKRGEGSDVGEKDAEDKDAEVSNEALELLDEDERDLGQVEESDDDKGWE